MAKIFIDGKEYEVKDGQNLLEASLSLGLNLPYFCWHPALDSVGACRQCAVKQFKDENDTQGKIVMACMTAADDGVRISIEDPEAREFRASIIEWMMVNHPHDCPICDEGGECHLQDMTMMTGHSYREFEFNKRTYRNQDLGPFINHEMNRCIQCYRCVRFYRDYAGGRDFDVFASHDHVYFGRAEDGALENEFSGNLVEVCPTGVFTDKTLKRHYTRKWDLQTAPSLCVQCGLGCNIIPGERYGELRRIRNRYNEAVNGYFLCDRGRYGYEFVNSERRIRRPLLQNDKMSESDETDKEAALQRIITILKDAKRAIGFGSPSASLESNFALRELVGEDNFYAGSSRNDDRLVRLGLSILSEGPVRTPSLREMEDADVVLILGEDLTNTAPRMALSLRQLVHRKACQVAEEFNIPDWNDIAIREIIQHEKEMVYIATPGETKLDDVALSTYRGAPDDIVRIGFAIAHALDANAPEVGKLPDDDQAFVDEATQALVGAEKPLIISGTSCMSEALMQAAANVAWALKKINPNIGLAYTMPEANSLGLALMGGGSLEDGFQAVEQGNADVIFILENDLYRRTDHARVDAFLEKAEHVIGLDYLENATNLQAEVVLPAGTFVEGEGTWVNSEGRAQRAYQVFVPDGEIRSSWRWLKEILIAMGKLPRDAWGNVDACLGALAEAAPVFEPALQAAPQADFRIAGEKIPRQSKRYSGRTAMHANVNVSEPKPPEDPDSPLVFSMEGYEGQPPSALIPRFWSPGWNSIQALNKFQSEIGGALKGGNPGCRLVKPKENASPAYYEEIPKVFQPDKDRWLLIPIHHIFGSEPLSMLSPGIAQRAPKPYLALGTDEAERLGVRDGDPIFISINGDVHRLPVKRLDSFANGLAGIPYGISGFPRVDLPVWVGLSKEGSSNE